MSINCSDWGLLTYIIQFRILEGRNYISYNFLIGDLSFSFSVIVGAPKSNQSLIDAFKGKGRGAVYVCPVKSDKPFTCNLITKSDQISKYNIFFLITKYR